MLSPLITVLILWGVWSGFWFFLSSTAQTAAHDWRAKAAGKGISLTCAKENWGGYPFRVEVSCIQPRFVNKKNGKETVARAGAVTALAQAYKPWHVILQITPPLNFEFPVAKRENTRLVVSASHDPGLASIRIDDKLKPQISILLENIMGDADVEVGDTDFPAGKFAMASANIHFRQEERESSHPLVLGIAATLEAVSFDGAVRDPINGGPVALDKVTFNGSLSGLPDRPSGTLQTLLRTLAANQGNLRIHRLNAEKAPVIAETSGDVAVDPDGRLQGKIKAKVQRLDHVIDQMEKTGQLTKNDAKVSRGIIKIMAGDNPNGEIVSDFRLKKGKLYFGPFKLLKVPPLF